MRVRHLKDRTRNRCLVLGLFLVALSAIGQQVLPPSQSGVKELTQKPSAVQTTGVHSACSNTG